MCTRPAARSCSAPPFDCQRDGGVGRVFPPRSADGTKLHMPRKKTSLWLRPLELLSVAAGADEAHEQAATGRQASGRRSPGQPPPCVRRTHRHRASGPRPGGQDARHVAPLVSFRRPERRPLREPSCLRVVSPRRTGDDSRHAGRRHAARLQAECRIVCRGHASASAERSGSPCCFPNRPRPRMRTAARWHGDATSRKPRRHVAGRRHRATARLRPRPDLWPACPPEPSRRRTAIRYPDRFAAVGLHSGPAIAPPSSTLAAMNLMRGLRRPDTRGRCVRRRRVYPGMPALVMHGALDTVVTDRNATARHRVRALNRLVDEHGAMRWASNAPMRATMPTTLTISGRASRRPGLHRPPAAACWSGGDPREPFHSATGPDATAMFWQFFRRQRRKRLR